MCRNLNVDDDDDENNVSRDCRVKKCWHFLEADATAGGQLEH